MSKCNVKGCESGLLICGYCADMKITQAEENMMELQAEMVGLVARKAPMKKIRKVSGLLAAISRLLEMYNAVIATTDNWELKFDRAYGPGAAKASRQLPPEEQQNVAEHYCGNCPLADYLSKGPNCCCSNS